MSNLNKLIKYITMEATKEFKNRESIADAGSPCCFGVGSSNWNYDSNPINQYPSTSTAYYLLGGLEEFPRYFINEKENKDCFEYRFCITGLSKEKIEVKLKNKVIYIFEKGVSGHIAYAPLCNKCSKMKIKSIKATYANGILSVSIKKEEEECLKIEIE